ncbi:MAG TPA: ATP-dependent helicase [Gammaproteobacteria bacterium]|nr:ATP-dependent helicase [Gammaproteobacteria bacterium]
MDACTAIDADEGPAPDAAPAGTAVRGVPAAFGESLNAAQRRAATFGVAGERGVAAGPLLIIAGAGTGKTNTLAHRVAHLLLHGVAPERILLLTFTRRAAQEMLHRAELIAGEALRAGNGAGRTAPEATRGLWSGTYHSIANRLLREYAQVLGLDASFSVLDRGDSADLLDLVRQELGCSKKDKRFPRKDTCLAIYSHRVNAGRPLAETLEEHFPWCIEWESELKALYKRYTEIKQSQHVLDYDDLLLYFRILVQEPRLARELGERFEHVLIDEYQDTNALQADIVHAMKPDGAGVCVVGDDAQAIYSFRGATVENILGFPERFSAKAEIVKLEENYRSIQPILDAANALMQGAERQYRKELRSRRASKRKPCYVTVQDDRAQALYVVEQVLAAREQGVPLRRQAVLMRSSHHSDALELELVRRNIPYVKYGGLKFLEAAHVKDVLAVLRWADNPHNRVAAFRTLQLLPGVGPATADRCLKVFESSGYSWPLLFEYRMPADAAEEWTALTALLERLTRAADWAGQLGLVREWYEPHLERIYDAARVRAADIEQLERLSMQYGSRERFITELTLDPPLVTGDLAGDPSLDEDYLILSTVHSAKGQEWDSVFVLNVADGNFPNEHATGKPALIEEERRLLYVAMTRAKQSLHLIAPLKYYVTQQSRVGDAHVYGARSRFMTEALLERFEQKAWPPSAEKGGAGAPAAGSGVRVDAAATLRAMWD